MSTGMQSRMVENWDLMIPNKIFCLVGSTGEEQRSGSLEAMSLEAGGGGLWWSVTHGSEMQSLAGESRWDLSPQRYQEGLDF